MLVTMPNWSNVACVSPKPRRVASLALDSQIAPPVMVAVVPLIMAVPAGFALMVDISAPRAPRAPPMATLRAVPKMSS